LKTVKLFVKYGIRIFFTFIVPIFSIEPTGILKCFGREENPAAKKILPANAG
jgi:hypothetical protein